MGTWNVVSVVLMTLAGCGYLLEFALLWSIGPWRGAISGYGAGAARSGPQTWGWPPGWSCSIPTGTLTVAEAHHTMQMHREHHCARKRAAFEVLIDAKHVAPDSSRPDGWRL